MGLTLSGWTLAVRRLLGAPRGPSARRQPRIGRHDFFIGGRKIAFFVANPRDSMQQLHAQGRFYEEEELALIAAWFLGGGTFLDVGANIGNHSLYALEFLGARRVIAVEPCPAALAVLRKNVAINGLEGRVTILPVGLSDRAGRLAFEMDPDCLALTRLTGVESPSGLEVERGDALLAGQRVDFVKIDVEGFELAVLRGLAGLIRDQRPPMFVEVDDSNLAGFHSWREAAGYRVEARFRRYPVNENYLIVPAAGE